MGARSFTQRILARLLEAEAGEPDPHWRDDYQIARLTVAHAASGNSQPHVAASYAVLGLHPRKVWPAIVERRKAQLGRHYDEFFGERPPKKPAQSVRSGEEHVRREAVGEDWRVETREKGVFGPVKASGAGIDSRAAPYACQTRQGMAATATAYRNSGAPPSKKRRNALSLNQVRELLESVDFSCRREAVIRRKTGRARGMRHYHRDHLRAALKGMWRASTQPFGVQILLFTSVEEFARGANRCERAMRYILRQLEKVEAIKLLHPANSLRRPATYELNVEKLEQMRTLPVRGQKAHEAHSRIASAPPLAIEPKQPEEEISAPAPALSPPRSESPPKLASKLTRDEKRWLEYRVRGLIKPLLKPSETLPADPLLRERWTRVLGFLESRINKHSFETWLKPTQASHETDGVLCVRVPTAEFHYAMEKYAALLRDTLAELHLPYKSLQFIATAEAKPVPQMTLMAAAAKACKEISTERRVIALEEAVVALKLAGFKFEPKGE